MREALAQDSPSRAEFSNSHKGIQNLPKVGTLERV